MVGTNVDIEFAVEIFEPNAAVDVRAGGGRAGGNTWTLSRCDTLKTWPGENGSILGVDELPLPAK